MRVLCKKTTSKDFDLKEVTTVLTNDHDYTHGGYGIELDHEYLVMGIIMSHDTHVTYYLIDTNGKPLWYPYLLFDVTDASVSHNWFIKIFGKDLGGDISMIIGYDELCNEEGYYNRLMDREETAMRIYFRRKIELENEYAS